MVSCDLWESELESPLCSSHFFPPPHSLLHHPRGRSRGGMGGDEGGGEAHGSCCVPFDGLLCCWSSLTLIYSHKSFVSFVIYRHVKDSATTAGLAPASVCSTLRCVHSTVHTSLFSQRIKDSATMAGLAPCERVFHAQVCALQITHISILAAQIGRASCRERVSHQV